MTAPRLTPAELARVIRFETADPAPESWTDWPKCGHCPHPWHGLTCTWSSCRCPGPHTPPQTPPDGP